MSFQFGGGNTWIEFLKLHKGKGYKMDQLKAMYAEAKANGTAPAPGLPHFGPRNQPKRMIGPRNKRVVPKATGSLAANFTGYCGGKTVAKASCKEPCRWTSNNGCVRGFGKQKTEKMSKMDRDTLFLQDRWKWLSHKKAAAAAPVDQTGGYWW
jgi:hypothetical protein